MILEVTVKKDAKHLGITKLVGEKFKVEYLGSSVNVIPMPSRIQGANSMQLMNIAAITCINQETKELMILPVDGTLEIKQPDPAPLKKLS